MPGLREVLVSFGMEVDPRDEAKVSSSLDKVVGIAKAAAAAFAAFKIGQIGSAFVDEIRGMGDELDKTSIQIGLATSELQALRHAANLAGVDGRGFSDSLAKLQKNAFEAAEGNETLSEMFEKVGVSVTDSNGELKSADELLSGVAEGISHLDNESEKVALSLTLMGRAGRRLLPMFTQGAAGLKAARDETERLGVGLTQEVIDKSVVLTDNQARMELSFLSLKNVIANELIPAFNEWALAMTEVAVAVRGPLKRALMGLRTVFRGIETGITFVTDRFDTLGKSLLALGVGLGVLGAAFAVAGKTGFLAGVKAAAGWVLATAPALLMVALMGVIIATIVLLIEDFQKMGEGAESVTGTIVRGFQDLVDELGSVPAAIDEMLKTAVGFWLRRFQEMLGISDEMIENFEETFGSLTQTAIAFWLDVKRRVVDTFEALADTIDGYVQTVKDSARAFSEWVDEHATGIRLVTSLVVGLATAIGIQYVKANGLALASFFRFKVGAIASTQAVSLSSIAAAASSAGAWLANAASMTIAWLQVGAMMVAEFLMMGVTAVATAVMSAAAWLAATLPIILTTALIGTLIGLVIWLGVELYKLLTGQENFFSTMTQGISDLIEKWGGIGPAIGAMLDEALRFWLGFFGATEEQVDTFVENLTDTLMSFWDNVVEYWGGVFDRFIEGVADKFGKVVGFLGGLFGGEDEPEPAPARAPARPARAPAPAPIVARQAPAAPVFRPLQAPAPVPMQAPAAGAPERAVIASGAAPEVPVFGAPEGGAFGAPPPDLRQQVIAQITGAMGAESGQQAGQTMTEGAQTLQAIAKPQAPSALAGAAVISPSATTAAPPITNSPTTNIDVSVDAQGQERPTAIADQVARQVDMALERRDRQTMRAFTTAIAAGGA